MSLCPVIWIHSWLRFKNNSKKTQDVPSNGRHLLRDSLDPDAPASLHTWKKNPTQVKLEWREIVLWIYISSKPVELWQCVHLLKDGRCLILSKSWWLSCCTLSSASFFLQHSTLRGCEWKCSSRASYSTRKWTVCLPRVRYWFYS